MRVKSSAEKEILKLSGVNAVDVGYKYVDGKRTDEICIRVHVSKKKKTVDKKQMIPAEIDGIKTDVLEGTYVPQMLSQKAITAEPLSDTVKYRPLKGGISIGPDRSVGGYIFTGTLGCMVTDVATSKTLMLSNFHVMCIDNGWHAGDQMNQPSLIDTGTHGDGVGTLLRAVLSSHVDGAVASINSGINTSASIVDIGNVTGTATAVLGEAVRKRGRTTLLTYGFVDGLNGTVNVDYGDGIGVKTLTNQILIRPDTTLNPRFSNSGDSGSAIVNGDNKVTGLLFAGSSSAPYLTIANPIGFVESELAVKVKKWRPIVKIKEKLEFKELKNEKFEIKEHKIEKLEHKEFDKIPDKIQDKIQEKIGENIPNIPNIPDLPHSATQGEDTSALENRIAQLELAVDQLTLFIETNLRPDLSKGGLENE